jgi:hypothetical protein
MAMQRAELTGGVFGIFQESDTVPKGQIVLEDAAFCELQGDLVVIQMKDKNKTIYKVCWLPLLMLAHVLILLLLI